MLDKLTSTKVTQILDVSMQTLNSWYKWYNDPDFVKPKDAPELPAYEQSGIRATRYWKKGDIPKLKAFQKWVPKGRGGVMGAYNKRFWSKKYYTKKSKNQSKNLYTPH